LGDSLIELNSRGVFSLAEANSRIRIIHKFTRDVAKTVDQILAKLEALGPNQPEVTRQLEMQVEQWIESWNAKVRKLGGLPKGLWLVDFDAGDGFFCWKFPEGEIKFWHDRSSGFTGRIPLPPSLSPHSTAEFDSQI
jgi:hypothetical protein